MIISLKEAQKIYPEATQVYLDGLEQMIIHYTQNSFLNFKIRFDINSYSDNGIQLNNIPFGLKSGDNVKISGSVASDGVYVIKAISDRKIELEGAEFYQIEPQFDVLTKVEYPADVISGVLNLVNYDSKMGSKIGVKSETVSRMSVTYYDVTAAESIEGYPISLLSFLDKYRLLRW